MVGVKSPMYMQAKEISYKRYKDLRSKIPSQLIQDFDELMEAHLDVIVAGMEEGFLDGFKLGAKLIVEILPQP